jgi:RNA polymerase sigma-70 factor (ECF subfamily)
MIGPGDKAELTRLVLEHMEDALRLATRLCGSAERAEDIAQEALYRAARGWQAFRRESHFRTWLFRIVVNAFRDSLRGTRAWVPLPVEMPGRGGDLVAAAEAKELEEIVGECIAALPPRQKEVVILRIVEELPASEVARILDVSEPNVHATLYAARQRLKQLLAPYLDEVSRE